VDSFFLAAIDVGSNAVRFAAAEFRAEEGPKRLETDRIPLRLGTDAFAAGALSPERLDATVDTLRMLRRRIDALGIVHYRAIGTSALRECTNAPDLVERVAREAGLRLEVIPSEEEARLGWRAMRDRVEIGERPWLVADLGGGSIELTLCDEHGAQWSRSGLLGSVRLLREFPEPLELDALRARLEPLRGELRAAVRDAGPPAGLLAAGGSIDTLAGLCELKPDARGIRALPLEALRDLIARLASLSVAERIDQLGLTPDRADVILHGALTYEMVADAAGVDVLAVPGVGVRDGLLLDLADGVAARKEHADPARVVFISDVHANVLALRAALEEADRLGAGQVVAAGDYVGDGPHPVEVVRMLRNAGIPCIRGNVDRKVTRLAGKKQKKLRKRLDEAPRSRLNRIWTALALQTRDNAEIDWLDALPPELRLEVGKARVLVVHGSPIADNDRIFSSLTPAALARKLAPAGATRPDVLVCGHTHAPFVASVDGVLVINCGSAGHPADGDNRGSLAVADLAETPPRAAIARFEYPIDALAADLASTDAPGIDEDEYREGVKP
jgi:putative phosphoesterase